MSNRRPSPDWLALSSPGHNRPLVPRVERRARHVRAVAAKVESDVGLPFEELYKPTRAGLGFTLVDRDVARRSAWALVGEWLVAASVQAPCASDGLSAAHEWFWRGSDRALGAVPEVRMSIDVEALELRALLPYLLDPMAAATRRDVLNANSTPHERRVRKATGVYYTPGDVAHLMVERVASRRTSLATDLWLDPAHGSGVFLRAVFCALGGRPDALDRIYGVDVDPIAAETASFVLTAESIANDPDGDRPWEVWHRVRRNLATGDALLIDPAPLTDAPTSLIDEMARSLDGNPLGSVRPWRLDSVFPETNASGFACIVANPPYAPLQRNAATHHISDLHPVAGPTVSADISPVFVELCTNLLPREGALAIVLPLSAVSSTRSPFPQLREYLAGQPGRLELLSFDRVPDALFGDDIKTRNSIVHLDRSAPSDITVSPLYRWTSRRRSSALGEAPIVSIAGIAEVPEVIPKIGSSWERELLLACQGHGRYLAHLTLSQRLSPLDNTGGALTGGDQLDLLALAPTAYNFLGVVRDPFRAVIDGHDSQNKFSILRYASEREASAAYALLSSRLAFWLWHVTGDGFHVTGALARRLPVPWREQERVERLADLGEQLWKDALQRPLISKNRGRTTVAYPPERDTQLVDEIDAVMEEVVGVPYGAQLAAWHEQLIVVDSDSERRNLIRRTKQ
ncbi:Eco57I restriction-modification methylase domain-containing protein [Cellulomonas alba]|uniref:site-specific DNA-methyltransferase (adenine-specific) n=1 Tax=Cellulomonas alba TaxID=3053467 RepID=A0ABT7SHZ3_9CELL|nr:hypothetical protein [Cellulomonas alba]MDM7855806.1 hypothetical protein [Cellulomonas alba]